MKLTSLFLQFVISLLLGSPAVTPTPDSLGREEDVRRAALDYIEGWYAGDAERVARVLHPEFVRRIAAVTTSGEDFFLNDTRESLLANARRGGDSATPVEAREIVITLLDLARRSAVVRVDSAWYTEYLNLADLAGQWQIVNILWENVPSDQTAIALDPRILSAYAGTYRHESGVEYEVVVEGERLFVKPSYEPRSEFFPESETEFFTRTFKSGLTFVRDASGATVALIIHQRYRDFRMEKVRDD